MKDLQFTVNDQEIRLDNKRCGNGLIVQGSRNYLRLKFRFRNWDNFEKHVQFIEGETHYEFLLDEDDSVKVPNNFIEDKIFKFLVVGYNLEADERVTTNTLQLKLTPTEFSDDIHSYEDDTEDVYRYLVNCLDGKANLSDLSAVALTGDYDDLTDKPSIPSKISDLTDDSDFIEKSDTSGLIRNDGSVDTTDYLSSAVLDGYIEKSDTVGLVKNDGTVDTSTYLTEHQSLSGYLKTTDVVDNLTSTSSTAPLSAKQGKILAGLIGDAILYINGSG